MLWFLPNSTGNKASSLTMENGSSASGFDINDLISGPRNLFWRGVASTGKICPSYLLATDLAVTHFVISRADWMLTQGTARLRPRQRNSSGTWSYISGVDFNPLVAANLIGITGQDLVFAVSPTDLRGFGMEFLTIAASAEAMQVSKFYPSVGFNFGINPKIDNNPPAEEKNDSGPQPNLFIPLHGSFPYETESRTTLFFEGLSGATVTAFKALEQLHRWPFFLYDDAADIWPWKLEHVLIEQITETENAQDAIDLQITFQRLKHYE